MMDEEVSGDAEMSEGKWTRVPIFTHKRMLITGIVLIIGTVLLIVAIIPLSISLSESSDDDDDPSAPPITRNYYIQSEEVIWDYVPFGYNRMTNSSFSDDVRLYVENGVNIIGPRYKKCIFRGYTSDNYSVPSSRSSSLGILGPTLYAQVGEEIRIFFRNTCKFPTSMHPHGVFYDKDSEGASYFPNLQASGSSVPPNGTHEYVWKVLDRSGPASGDLSSMAWLYHSHVNEIADVNGGLIGAIIVTRRGELKAEQSVLSVRGIDREFVSLWSVMDENESQYLDENIDLFIEGVSAMSEANRTSLKQDPEFEEGNRKHGINGRLFGNGEGFEMKKGETVRWYLLALGSEQDIHTAHWHGQTVVAEGGHRKDVIALLPGESKVVDMVPDNVGTWMWHCHVNDHINAGMVGSFRVQE